jgi:hypothetical protein
MLQAMIEFGFVVLSRMNLSQVIGVANILTTVMMSGGGSGCAPAESYAGENLMAYEKAELVSMVKKLQGTCCANALSFGFGLRARLRGGRGDSSTFVPLHFLCSFATPPFITTWVVCDYRMKRHNLCGRNGQGAVCIWWAVHRR